MIKINHFLNFRFTSFLLLLALHNLLLINFSAQENPLSLETVIELTLSNNPDIIIAKNNSLSKFSQYQFSLAEFDPTFNFSTNYIKNKDPLQFGLDILLPEQQTISYNASFVKKFDWGISLSPSLIVSQNDYALGLTTSKVTQSRFNFKIDIPLLKNGGYLGSGAKTEAQEILYETAKYSAKFAVSEQIKNSIFAFLDLGVSKEKLNIYKDSENRAKKLVEITKILIRADKRPSREIDIVEANLAEKVGVRINNEKSVFDLKQSLILQLGTEFNDIEFSSSTFKIDLAEIKHLKLEQNTFLKSALKKRGDINSLILQAKAQKLLKNSAERNMLNQLNLSMNIGYSGLIPTANFSDLYNAIYPQNKGISYSVGLSYELPVNNLISESELLRNKVEYENSLINLDNKKRIVKSEVLKSLNNLELTSLELEQAINSLNLFKKSYENEVFKQEKGLSTFFEVTQTEQKLTSAFLNSLNAQSNYIKAIINLKHVSGILLQELNDGNYRVDVENLFGFSNNLKE